MAKQISAEEAEDVRNKYTGLQEAIQLTMQKIGQIESDRSEYLLVLKTLSGLENAGKRRCWHQIGEVLSEQTTEDVVPVLVKQKELMEETLNKLSADLKAKESAMEELRDKYDIIDRRTQ